MEFTNEIFFNKSLTADETASITYSGKLYREHSEEIYIVYGYGPNWEHTEETKMVETENGFEVTLSIKNYDTFNFCFKNNFNIWDNNSGFNYISSITPKQEIVEDTSTTETEETVSEEITENNKINTEIIETNEIPNNITSEQSEELPTQDNNTSSETTENNSDNDDNDNNISFCGTIDNSTDSYIADESSSEDIDEEESNEVESDTAKSEPAEVENEVQEDHFQTQSDVEINTLFSSLLDSLLDDTTNNTTIDVNSLEGYGLQSVDEIKEENFDNSDELLKEFYEELSTIPSSIGNNQQIDELFNSLFKNIDESVQVKEETKTPELSLDKFDVSGLDQLNNLVDSIVASIENDKSNNTDSVSPVEPITDFSSSTNNLSERNVEDIVSGLPAIQSESWFDKFVDGSYSFIKKTGTALKKFGKLIKLKAQEYGIIHEK